MGDYFDDLADQKVFENLGTKLAQAGDEGVFHTRERFANGYGISVIRNQYSYGGRDGLFELAVLDDMGWITYDTPVTDDVIGGATPGAVIHLAKMVAAL